MSQLWNKNLVLDKLKKLLNRQKMSYPCVTKCKTGSHGNHFKPHHLKTSGSGHKRNTQLQWRPPNACHANLIVCWGMLCLEKPRISIYRCHGVKTGPILVFFQIIQRIGVFYAKTCNIFVAKVLIFCKLCVVWTEHACTAQWRHQTCLWAHCVISWQEASPK